MNNDIFDEIEKSIDDAFKPEEKKNDPWNNRNKHKGYMFNEAYDKLLRDKWEWEYKQRHFRPLSDTVPHRQKMRCLKCGSDITVEFMYNENEMPYYRRADQHTFLPYSYNMKVSHFFCPICGEMFRIHADKIIKVLTEVSE